LSEIIRVIIQKRHTNSYFANVPFGVVWFW